MPAPARKIATPESLLRAALWLILLSVVATTKADPDLWGHVRFGQDMIRARTVHMADAYSFTSDRPWVNHEWAAEAAFAAAYDAAGGPGLIALKLIVVLGVLLLLNRVLSGEGVEDAQRRDLLVALAVITTIQQAHHVRPQIFSLLFFSGLLACLLAAARRPGFAWAAPAIFAAWVNFHGGWLVGGGALALWALGTALSPRAGPRGAAVLVAAGIASLAATLLNPAGAGMHRFLVETVGFGRADITEWQPVYAVGPSIWGLWLLVAILALAGGIRMCRTDPRAERLLVVAALAVASFRVNRLTAFFALATLFLLGPALAAALPFQHGVSATRRRQAVLPTVVISMVLAAAALRSLAVNAACVRSDPRTLAEPASLEFLRAHAVRGRLLVWFDWGELALWHLAPDVRVSIDGRRETVYSAAVQDRHLRFFFDAPGGAALPDELAADYIWIPKGLPAAVRLQQDGWARVYDGDPSAIFARGPLPGAVPAAPLPGRPGCFPNP